MPKLSNQDKKANSLRPSGFTIVELLIVIVVIAILAAITVVAYNGIQTRSKETAVKSDLKQASTQLELDKIDISSYPTTTNTLKPSPETNLEITSDGISYCLSATSSPNIAFHITNTNKTPQEGVCTGHQAPSGDGVEIANNSPIQNTTQAQCQALPVYDATNPSAIRTVTDSRGGSTRTYEIAKLADNKCWMLANLKLGSTTGSITLTPADSDVSSNFTLPQAQTGGSSSFDNPTVSGPVPGNTSSGATDYGYLYNWSAATAGETRTTMPGDSGNAPHSICPKGWRLPTGSSTGEFALLNAKMNNPSATGPSTSGGTGYYQNWQYAGPFKGVFAGYWWEGFSGQSSYGVLWSSSTFPSNLNADDAFYAYLGASSVDPGDGYGRGGGFGVRCLLK